jgi:glucuronoarabinoxylan endo-1,4-beta-xylanase
MFLLSPSTSAVTVTIDSATKYQTIDGFGWHGAANVWWSGGPFFNDTWLGNVIDTLGLTIMRNEYYPPTDGQCSFSKQTPFLQAIKAKAVARNEPLEFIYSIWSPPAAYKSNNSTVMGTLHRFRQLPGVRDCRLCEHRHKPLRDQPAERTRG